MRPWPVRFAPALALAAGLACAAEGGRTPQPAVVVEPKEGCISSPAEMRRKHMDLLAHQRDRTVHEGVRGAPASLNACISCHANSSNGAVTGSAQNFCQGCHGFAAVKLDCFECHQPAPPRGAGGPAGRGGVK